MNILKVLGFNNGSNLAPVVDDDKPKVLSDGKVIFTIYKDGNGFYSAQHYYKTIYGYQWLFSYEGLITKYEYRLKTKSLESIQEACRNYINSIQMEEVGEIKFHPAQ